MIRNSWRIIQITFAMLTCSILAFLCIGIALRDRPVLADLHNNVLDHHGFQLLNPFRNRSPERAANKFLASLSKGQCSTVLARLGEDPIRTRSTCESELKYPMRRWQLEAIGRDDDRMVLRYEISREAGGKMVHDPFWIWVSNMGDQNYNVTGYEQWY